ncbi:MAG: hypothetical protein JWN39_814 [Ilumatobacteraceae bacterium]|nr:hypothetical protein [Ilumatobacteraceae bacterium]
MTAGAALAVVGSFLPWLKSGAVGRSSYDILGLVDRLGFAPDGPIRLVVRAWPLMPLVLTVGIVAVWWGRRWAGAGFGVLGGLYAGGLGAAVAGAIPDTHQISVGAAPVVTAVGGAIVIVGSLLALVVRVPSAHANPS